MRNAGRTARVTTSTRARKAVMVGAGAIEGLGELADRAQAMTANVHATLVTSPLFELADAAIDTSDAEAMKAAGLQ